MYKKNSKLILNFVLIICIVLSTYFLSIGYAAINATTIDVGGIVSAKALVGILISDVKYFSDNEADLANSKIIDYTGTMLHSDIYLSASNTNSSITYTVTILNNSGATRTFSGVTYSDGFYSNQNIAYRFDGLNVNDVINKGESKTFDITFYYDNISTISDNHLDSYLNFNFEYYLDGENEIDIFVEDETTYDFEGVTEETPTTIQNIANISFMVQNGAVNSISGIQVGIVYTTSTGSKQSATITLVNEDGTTIQTQTAQFQGKQNNTLLNVDFTGINIPNGSKVTVKFNQSTVTNGQVDISGITITPIF